MQRKERNSSRISGLVHILFLSLMQVPYCSMVPVDLAPTLMKRRWRAQNQGEGTVVCQARQWPVQWSCLQGPAERRVLVAPNLGIANGSPDIKDKLIRKGKVTKLLIQGLGKFIRILLVLAQLHHCSSYAGRRTK